jgi:hypothetical protein
VDPAFSGGEEHVTMLVGMPRADGHDVRFRLVQHLQIIREGFGGAQAGLGGGPSRVVGISHTDDFRFVLHRPPANVEAVAEISAASVADDGDFNFATVGGIGKQMGRTQTRSSDSCSESLDDFTSIDHLRILLVRALNVGMASQQPL